MLRFANQVAEEVTKEFPDKLLLFLIYSQYRTPPKRVKLHPNVIAQFCTMTWSHVSDDVHHKEVAMLEGLQGFTEKRGIYDYFVNGANGALPRGFARTFHRSLGRYYDAGCRYFATQSGLDFATGGFAYYLAARCLWDMSLSLEDVLDDYCVSGFGAAASAVKSYLTGVMDRWEETEGGKTMTSGPMEDLAAALYPREWRAERRQELAAAAEACRGDESAQGRVGFLTQGLDFLDRHVEACAALRDLVAAGAPDDRRADPEAISQWVGGLEDKEKVRRAVRLRRELLEWVDRHADGFWITAMWFQYQRVARGGKLGPWMDAAEDALGR